MKTFTLVVSGLLTVFCIIEGFTKIMLASGDVELFGGIGFSETEIKLYGLVYLIGGVLLVFDITRRWAGVLMSIVFCTTGAVIFMSGNFAYGFASMIPLFMVFFVLKEGFNIGKPEESEYKVQ